jgi:hypothetical protein
LVSFTSGEIAPDTPWIGGWVGPITDLEDVEKRKLLTLLGLELDRFIQLVGSHYTDCAIAASSHLVYNCVVVYNELCNET